MLDLDIKREGRALAMAIVLTAVVAAIGFGIVCLAVTWPYAYWSVAILGAVVFFYTGLR